MKGYFSHLCCIRSSLRDRLVSSLMFYIFLPAFLSTVLFKSSCDPWEITKSPAFESLPLRRCGEQQKKVFMLLSLEKYHVAIQPYVT